ncbi:hypothetical protein [Blautia sp. MSJ-19]|uniref:hypothetical protein n=1 Tax=Blautia sp. MSJ-19 TaxID=2841517 RepID=UPI001C0EBF9B|nr:hypothetical protein [Blautia sp. MSJ-19]MBU5482462.1 hypothetical protein [Blautia sp. MSJ-19]
MIKVLKRFLILLLVFVLGVAGTAFLMSNENTDDRSDMNIPTLPEVMVDFNGTLANRMYGYRQQMEADFVRDSVTPLDTTKKLTIAVNPYDAKVKSLSYEVRTSDGTKIVENRKIKDLTTSDSDGYLRAQIEISSGLLMNQEYSLQITLDTDGGEAYYYTRVVSRSSTNTQDYIKFASDFVQMCMDKNSADNLAAYLESAESSSTNFASVSIKSPLSVISWGNLGPQISKKGIPVIKEINETTASIALEYEIMAANENGGAEYYNVTDFYRLRYTESRIRLLDFERSTRQVFDPKQSVVTDDGLLLGVRDKAVSSLSNDDGSVTAFVQEGALWTYAPDTGKFVDVFDFRKSAKGDFRDSRVEHDIKLLSVDAGGDVDFMVYGYMNRGTYEGYCGVGIYHYNHDQNVVEERVFIPSTESYEFLKEDLGTLSYVNKDNQLFLLLSGSLYQINIDENSYDVLSENIDGDEFAVSETNAHAAWRITDGDNAGQVEIIDFDTLETRNNTPEAGQSLKVLGFMNEDLIYGVVMDGDSLTDENGHTTEGITTVKIEGFDGKVKKEYHQDGYYVTNVTVGSTLMEFDLSQKNGNSYVVKTKDNIMNNKATSADFVSVEQTSSKRQGTAVKLVFQNKPETSEALILTAKMKNTGENVVEVNVEKSLDQEIYYVYARGGLDSTWSDPAQAVLQADSRTGVVLNRAQQYVWERGNMKTQLTLNTEDVPEIIRSGSWDKETLQNGLGDTGTVIDLTGCSLENVLYEISAQRAVIAKTGADSSVVIVGYDEYNTWLLDPATGEVSPYGMNDSTDLFQKAGNVFISYLDNQK